MFIIAKNGSNPKTVDRLMDKEWYIHITEYYSAIKRNEILTHATTWMNPVNIMLSKISQSQKDKYCMILLV